MKKLLLTILSLVCVFACTFGIAACGQTETGNSDTYTVTQTEWDTIFDGTFDKFAVSYTVPAEEGGESVTVVYKFDFVKKYFYMSYHEGDDFVQEIYTDKGNNQGYSYAKRVGWQKWKAGEFQIDEDSAYMFDRQNEYYDFLHALKNKFSEFTYDAESKQYVGGVLKVSDEMGTAQSVFIGFKNGKLVSAEYKDVENEMFRCTYTFSFEDFEIEIPAQYEEDR